MRITSIRLFLALAAYLDLELFQINVKTTSFNGNLEEEIYMDQPISFVLKGQEEQVCSLKKFIYGLKQSSRAWYFRFHKAIISFGLNMISEDHCVYVKKTIKGIMLSLIHI